MLEQSGVILEIVGGKGLAVKRSSKGRVLLGRVTGKKVWRRKVEGEAMRRGVEVWFVLQNGSGDWEFVENKLWKVYLW